jgi:hypothetical protein
MRGAGSAGGSATGEGCFSKSQAKIRHQLARILEARQIAKLQSANQSLITDVFRSRPLLCAIHSRHPSSQQGSQRAINRALGA